jgi:secretion/DNA translocation related TadE-like protein
VRQKARALVASRADHGSGTVLALSVAFVGVSLFAVLQLGAVRLLQETRTQAAADAAAIAAEDSLRGLSTGYPCNVAKQLVEENGMDLQQCRIVNLEVFITVQSETLGIVLSARARAGA